MMAAAAATKTIKIGSGICLVIEHDPIKLAKEVASLDLLSNGRVLFGIGGGWNAEEMENHGTPFKKRWKVLREKIEAMKEIWTKENAEYHGEFVNFDPIWCHPKPVQKPHPPILLGVHSGNGLNRVVNYCDGWIPVGAAMPDFRASLQDLRARAENAGRKPQALAVSIFMGPAKEDALRQYRELGIERVVFGVPSGGKEKVLPMIDRYAIFVPICVTEAIMSAVTAPRTTEDLCERFGPPEDLAVKHKLPYIDDAARRFIAQCPFVILATADAQGRCDASPKGDPPGFIHIADERTLYIPDRSGNKMFQSMNNILTNPHWDDLPDPGRRMDHAHQWRSARGG
jgi:probable F420-dependent oxidoreductase